MESFAIDWHYFFCLTAVLDIKASDRYKDAEKFGSFHYRIYHPTKVLSLVILELKASSLRYYKVVN